VTRCYVSFVVFGVFSHDTTTKTDCLGVLKSLFARVRSLGTVSTSRRHASLTHGSLVRAIKLTRSRLRTITFRLRARTAVRARRFRPSGARVGRLRRLAVRSKRARGFPFGGETYPSHTVPGVSRDSSVYRFRRVTKQRQTGTAFVRHTKYVFSSSAGDGLTRVRVRNYHPVRVKVCTVHCTNGIHLEFQTSKPQEEASSGNSKTVRVARAR